MREARSFLPLPHKSLDILLALAEGEAHGYGIKRFVEERSGRRLRAATLYDAVARLHRDGLIHESAT
ncbi:MAG: PadR family transcriptional regulator, partial [Holophagales bacterium]|nr:PadR family transcriptional regulator [Holophagales bacterium]